LLGSYPSRRLQRSANEWVFGLFRQGEQAVAVVAIDLKAVPDSAGLLPKHARAGWATDFDLIVHSKYLNETMQSCMPSLTEPLKITIQLDAAYVGQLKICECHGG
jgi:hypothetical protein